MTTPSSRAKEIASEIVIRKNSPLGEWLVFIAKVLEDYAREAVEREYKEPDMARWFREGYEAGAAEMRELAARVTDGYWEDGWGNGASADRCGQEIRALPLTPTPTKTTMPDPTHAGKDKEAGND